MCARGFVHGKAGVTWLWVSEMGYEVEKGPLQEQFMLFGSVCSLQPSSWQRAKGLILLWQHRNFQSFKLLGSAGLLFISLQELAIAN